MDPIRRITLRLLQGAPDDFSFRLASYQFAPPSWQPAINAYRCEKGIRIGVELAGVERSAIDLRVESHRVIIRGRRDITEPKQPFESAVEMLAMEIDYGPFERTIELFDEVDVEKVHAEQTNGLLWIHLPFAS
jgi:HSP20 family molecular chaperone IbpA